MSEPAREYTPGEMEVVEQVSTYGAFNGLLKWASLAIGALLLFLVMWLCAGAGLPAAFVVTAIVVGIGVVFLRGGGKPAGDPDH